MYIKIEEIEKGSKIYESFDAISVTASSTYTIKLKNTNEDISILLEVGILYPLGVINFSSSVNGTAVMYGWRK